MREPDDWIVNFPTLGFLVADWIESHCRVPDGFFKGDSFVMYDWQLWCTVNHYRVKPSARVGQLAPAFQNRRSQVVAPQKTGKGPWSATIIAAEAVGPVLFNGWAEGGETFRCSCGCGFVYQYDPGEPMGMAWPTPLIQLLATSEDQTANVYRPLQAMIREGPLSQWMRPGEEFIRLPNDGRIDVVTSSATSRLGNPITFALQDETGFYTRQNRMVAVAETQRRGLAGMGGRALETTNAWDPSEDSTAQRTAEAERPDVWRFHRVPPPKWSYTNKAERRKIHRFVYHGSDHVDLDAIEAEAVEILEKDPPQAERFFGNRLVTGAAAWMDEEAWKIQARPEVHVAPKSQITLGFDGSLGAFESRRKPDATALGASRVDDGHLFTLGIWEPQHSDDGLWTWEPPRDEIDRAVEEAFSEYDVILLWADPQHWQNDIGRWAQTYGSERVVERWTNNDSWMAKELDRIHTAVLNGDVTHDGDEDATRHVLNAQRYVKRSQTADPDGRRERVLVTKKHRNSPEKIDMVPTWVLAYAARAHVLEKSLHVRQARTAPLYTH